MVTQDQDLVPAPRESASRIAAAIAHPLDSTPPVRAAATPGVHPSSRSVIVAGVLVGGRSRRMGRPKTLLPRPDGTSYVEHMVNVARAVADDVVLLGENAVLPPSLRCMRVLPDAPRGSGPLGGLGALLEYAGPRWSLLLACDLPHLHPRLLQLLCGRATPSTDVVAFVQRRQPRVYHVCCALYSPRVVRAVRQQLVREEMSLQALLARLCVTGLLPNAEEARQLANVNTPEDAADAFRTCGPVMDRLPLA